MSHTTDAKRSHRARPFPDRPPRFTGDELKNLTEALGRNNLFYHQEDGFTARMCRRACELFGARHAVAASSGTAALHAAVGGLGVRAGAEVITTPITDMGTLIAILYQNAIPVFADVDPRAYNLTAESIERVMTDRTEAVIVVHLTGNPAEMDDIIALCRSRNVALIEDAAQAYGCTYRGRHVGTFGDCGCFSLNDFKHISAGDGGFILTDNEDLFYRCHDFADKHYDRHGRGCRLAGLAPNYRMTELQAAVALAQMDRMRAVTDRRHELGTRLSAALADVPGILPPRVPEGGACSYWFYMFRVDADVLGIDRDTFCARLKELNIPAGAGYIPNPLYREPVFCDKSFFPGGVWPAELAAGRRYDYTATRCPNAERVLDTAVTLPLHEGMDETDVDDYAAAIARVAGTARNETA